MKTTLLQTTVALWVAAVCVSILADEAVNPAAKPDRLFTGIVATVNAKDRAFTATSFLIKKRFVIGNDCAISLADKKIAQLADLRAGHSVSVAYRDASGVAVARRVAQQTMTVKGSIDALDSRTRTLAVRQGWLLKKFVLPPDCKIVLRDDRKGGLDGLKVGHPVTVAYTKIGGKPAAYRVEQSSQEFAGTISAIDLSANLVKARHLAANPEFRVARGCNIIVNGRKNARLTDLKLGEEAEFSFEEVTGVRIVHRISQGMEPAVATVRERAPSPEELRRDLQTTSANP